MSPRKDFFEPRETEFSKAKAARQTEPSLEDHGRDLMRAGIVLLSAAEVQSGADRQSWAEGLIRQLPVTHNGRNSWLINYGVSAEAVERRENWNARAVKDGREPSCVFNPTTRSTGRPALAKGATP